MNVTDFVEKSGVIGILKIKRHLFCDRHFIDNFLKLQ